MVFLSEQELFGPRGAPRNVDTWYHLHGHSGPFMMQYKAFKPITESDKEYLALEKLLHTARSHVAAQKRAVVPLVEAHQQLKAYRELALSPEGRSSLNQRIDDFLAEDIPLSFGVNSESELGKEIKGTLDAYSTRLAAYHSTGHVDALREGRERIDRNFERVMGGVFGFVIYGFGFMGISRFRDAATEKNAA